MELASPLPGPGLAAREVLTKILRNSARDTQPVTFGNFGNSTAGDTTGATQLYPELLKRVLSQF